MARNCRIPEDLQKNQTRGWSGTDDQNEGKPGTGKGRSTKTQETQNRSIIHRHELRSRWQLDWRTDLWTDPPWKQAARQLPPKEQSNLTQGGMMRDNKVNKMTGTEIGTTVGTVGTNGHKIVT